MNTPKLYDPEQKREDILKAAEERFRTYGFNKTTMAEIAKDCDMSAANLYRFFQNKLDIGASLACNCLNDEVTLLQSIVDTTDQPAAERLKQFVIGIFEHTHSQWSEQPRMNELVTAICSEKMDIVDNHMDTKISLLSSLISQGNASGEFDVENPAVTAEAILSATIMFDLPLFMPMFSHEDLLRKANNVVSLILTGVLKR